MGVRKQFSCGAATDLPSFNAVHYKNSHMDSANH